MPELTPQDRESYLKLYDAAKTLSEKIPNESGSNTLKELTSAFFTELNLIKPEAISSFDQLQSQIELTGGYLTVYQLFAKAIESIKGNAANETKAAINEASQKLSIQYNQLKVSLEAVDSDFLEDLTTLHSDPLFLGLLTDADVKNWTNQILSDRTPALTDSDVQKLTDAWGTAVTNFVEDARKQGEPGGQVKPGQTKTIAQFFCIHDQLEGLYSELSTAVALNS